VELPRIALRAWHGLTGDSSGARKMTTIDAEIEDLREIVRKLEPSGPDGFEGLLAAVLTDILKVLFVLAKSGSQRGRDGDSSLSDQAIKFEAKLYKDGVPKDQVLSKLAEISADEQGQTDLWILGSTGPVAAQDVQTAKNFGRQMGVSVLIFDWSSAGLPSLPTLLALAPEVTAGFLSQKLSLDESALKAKIATVETHPQFVDRSDELKVALWEPSLAPAYARSANEEWLRDAFQNAKRARDVFGQPLAPGDAATAGILDRQAIRERYAKALFATPNNAIAVLLGVDGSGKSWLFAQTWLTQPEKVLTLVLVPHDFVDISTSEAIEDLLISKCIVQTGETVTDAAKARWRRYFKRWRRFALLVRPTLLVFVDGINERSNLPWGRILDTLNGLLGDLHGKLTISCRTAFFRDRLETRLSSAVDVMIVPEWSEAELGQLLSARGIEAKKLTPAVADFLKNPRIFAIASRLLDMRQIEQIEELSVSRLLFEHLRSTDPGVAVSPAQFVHHVRDHANVILKRLQEQHVDDLTIFGPSEARNEAGSVWNQQFDAVSAGRFFEPLESDLTLYRLRDDGLPLALGLSLLSTAQKAERNNADLDEELSRILDPIAALDKTSDVLLAAVVAAVLDGRALDKVAAALIRAFVGLQNADPARYPEFRALARNRPVPFLMALELAALRQGLAPNLSWLTEAIFEIRDEPACSPAVDEHLHRWLNFFSESPLRRIVRHGLTAEQQAVEIAKQKAEIDQRLAALSTPERKILDELVPEERGDYAHLSFIAFHLLAGRPLAPFVRSLRNWKFADGLNGGFTPYAELPNLFAFNRVDWAEARLALLQQLDDLKGADVSTTGRWAHAGLLQATGALDDAKEAAALIEELTKDRPRFPGWRLIETFCATDPCYPVSERPSNIDETAKKYPAIDFRNIHNARGGGPEQHFFEGAMVGLARFEPDAAISALRKLAADILSREETGFRYGVFFLEDHTAALDDDTAKKFVPKAAAVGAQALLIEDKHKQMWISTQYALLIAFPHMSGDEQLEALVSHPEDDNLIVELGDAMRPCDKDRFRIELQKAVSNGDTWVQFRLLAFARWNGINLDDATKTLVSGLVVSPSNIVRVCALGLIARLQDIGMLRSVVASGWTASSLNNTEHSFEIWYGSRVLVQAVVHALLSDEECLKRIALSAYPDFVQARGTRGAAFIAPRLDAAIERASRYRTDLNLPEIEEKAALPDRPVGYYLKDKPNPRESQLETLKRLSGNPESFFDRHDRNRTAFDAFVRDLTRAGAELLIESVTDNLVSAIAAIDLPLVEKWHQLFMGMDFRALSQMHNIAILVAEVMSRRDPPASAALFKRLIHAPPIVRVTLGQAGIDLYAASLWSAGDADAMQTLRFERLDQASNDEMIAVEVLAALRAGKEHLLRDYVADRIARPGPSYVARAIMVAGFSNCPDWAVQTVAQFEDAYGFLGEAYDAAKYAMDRYRWSVHWAELIDKARTETELWRYAVILSKIVDGRFYYQGSAPAPDSLLARYANSLEGLIRTRIKSWQNKRAKKLFGMDAPDAAYLR
jgi:hypothetical protein